MANSSNSAKKKGRERYTKKAAAARDKKAEKAEKKPREPRFSGFRKLFTVAVKAFLLPLAICSVMTFVSAALTSAFKATAAYAITIALSLVLCAATATVSARNAMKYAKCGAAAAFLPSEMQPQLRPETVALSELTSFSAAGLFGAAVIFCSALTVTDVTLSAACAVLYLSASLYVSALSSAVATSHDTHDRAGRRAFIKGFVGLYTVGLIALVIFLFPASYLPLGEDFKTDSIPHAALLSLSLLYFAAAALRVFVIYFILRRRIKASAGMKNKTLPQKREKTKRRHRR